MIYKVHVFNNNKYKGINVKLNEYLLKVKMLSCETFRRMRIQGPTKEKKHVK